MTAPSDEPRPLNRFMQAVYDELRKLAESYMAGERKDHTLQTTGLVHEAYLRLREDAREPWRGQGHFIAHAARAMRQVLVEHARARSREKRGGKREREPLDEQVAATRFDPTELLALDDALHRLSTSSPRAARVVEMRFFGGMSTAEIGEVLGVTMRTVERDWCYARAWLRRELDREGAARGGVHLVSP